MKSTYVTCVACFCLTFAAADNYEKQLYRYLRTQIDKLERPVANSSDTLQVSLSITLNQIIGLVSVNLGLLHNKSNTIDWIFEFELSITPFSR